jgi:hypothetical protein
LNEDFIVLKFPLVAREEVNDGRRPLERKRACGDCGGEKTALVPFAPFVCCLDEVGRGDCMIGDGGCGDLIVTTDSLEMLELTVKRMGDGEGGLSGCGDSSRMSSVLRLDGVGVVGATRVGVDTGEIEGVDSMKGKEFLITGLGL